MVFKFSSGGVGGGHQFLRGLKNCLISQSGYSENPQEADVILFNSHHQINDVARLKKKYPGKPFMHRIDGPMRLYNCMSDRRDHIVTTANRLIADGTLFQSNWSQKQNYSLGLQPTPFQTIVFNAPDGDVFNEKGRGPLRAGKKIRLIAVSWSPHKNKGFDIYEWMDEHLDFSRYEMIFLGNSPVKFKNIQSLAPLDSDGVAQKLKESDIYVTGSRNDPCSNSLIEALYCGLPALVKNDGGHPEILGGSGELFSEACEIPVLLEKISLNLQNYKLKLKPSIKEVTANYTGFAQLLLDNIEKKNYQPKNPSAVDFLRLNGSLLLNNCISRALSG